MTDVEYHEEKIVLDQRRIQRILDAAVQPIDGDAPSPLKVIEAAIHALAILICAFGVPTPELRKDMAEALDAAIEARIRPSDLVKN